MQVDHGARDLGASRDELTHLGLRHRPTLKEGIAKNLEEVGDELHVLASGERPEVEVEVPREGKKESRSYRTAVIFNEIEVRARDSEASRHGTLSQALFQPHRPDPAAQPHRSILRAHSEKFTTFTDLQPLRMFLSIL